MQENPGLSAEYIDISGIREFSYVLDHSNNLDSETIWNGTIDNIDKITALSEDCQNELFIHVEMAKVSLQNEFLSLWQVTNFIFNSRIQLVQNHI